MSLVEVVLRLCVSSTVYLPSVRPKRLVWIIISGKNIRKQSHEDTVRLNSSFGTCNSLFLIKMSPKWPEMRKTKLLLF